MQEFLGHAKTVIANAELIFAEFAIWVEKFMYSEVDVGAFGGIFECIRQNVVQHLLDASPIAHRSFI